MSRVFLEPAVYPELCRGLGDHKEPVIAHGNIDNKIAGVRGVGFNIVNMGHLSPS
ncbi:hypothetical protein D3C73_1030910 [compost metagenome]